MIQIFKNTGELSKAAAELFLQTAQKAVQKTGKFNVALTGGSSPAEMYRLLAQAPYKEQVPWAQTYIFWGDERWVPLTDDKSNAKMAFELFLNQVPVPRDQIFPMWGKENPETFAQLYQNRLQQHFNQSVPAFDLILLGLGDDGHTASLFPHTQVLQEKERIVSAYYLEPQQMHRVTLTAPVLNEAKKILFLTFGEKKASALSEILEGSYQPDMYPAQLVKPTTGEVVWFVDEAAASRLKK